MLPRAALLLLAVPALGCTETHDLVTVGDPAAVRVVPLPPRSSLVRAEDGAVTLRWPRTIGGSTETQVTPIVDGAGRVAPHLRTFDVYDIESPLGQVAIPDRICFRRQGGVCQEAHAYEIVAPLETVREIRRVTRVDPAGAWTLLVGGVAAGLTAPLSFSAEGDRRENVAVGTGLAALSAVAIAAAVYLFRTPPKSTTLYPAAVDAGADEANGASGSLTPSSPPRTPSSTSH